jgi:hypothetical protein
MNIQGKGIQMDARVIQRMELHENRLLVVLRYRRHKREDLGELRIQFKKKDHARGFFEKVKAASLSKVQLLNINEYSIHVDPYEYEKYVDEELKVLGGDESFRFNHNMHSHGDKLP